MEIVYRQPQGEAGRTYVFLTANVDFDCDGMRSHIVHIIMRNETLQVVGEGDTNRPWDKVEPDTNFDKMRLALCEGRFPEGSVILTDPLTTIRARLLG